MPEPQSLVTRTPTSGSTFSEESWALAAKWLSDCTQKHVHCKGPASHSWYPTRLLDLGSPTKPPCQPRLIVTKEIQPPAGSRYVTLSHRWGNTTQKQLTKDSVVALQSGIDDSRLPQTFQDAMFVAKHRLSIRYLWIDTFCIFQDPDDLSDWVREAAQMGNIYENAYCNLSATGSRDSSQGLFFDRDPSLLRHHEISTAITVSDAAATMKTYALIDSDYWSIHLSRMPLLERGWVLQERLLARRVLHFTSDMLAWECVETDATETYPNGLPIVLDETPTAHFKSLDLSLVRRRLQGPHPGKETGSRGLTHHLWPRIVDSYSQCALSKSEDKLIALSGIAKRMSSILRDDYVVGMWRRYLESELGWYVLDHRQKDGSPSKRASPYRAPSFSWASIDGCVSAATSTDEALRCSIADLWIDYATKDTAGLVRGGHIILKGALKQVQVQRSRSGDVFIVLSGTGDAFTTEIGTSVFLDVDQESFDDQNKAGLLFYIALLMRETKRGTSLQGLLLLHQGGGVFVRLGFCETFSDCYEYLVRSCSASPENEALLPCLSFHPDDHAHTIKIV